MAEVLSTLYDEEIDAVVRSAAQTSRLSSELISVNPIPQIGKCFEDY
jgi:hypothetical protein